MSLNRIWETRNLAPALNLQIEKACVCSSICSNAHRILSTRRVKQTTNSRVELPLQRRTHGFEKADCNDSLIRVDCIDRTERIAPSYDDSKRHWRQLLICNLVSVFATPCNVCWVKRKAPLASFTSLEQFEAPKLRQWRSYIRWLVGWCVVTCVS